MPDESPLHPPNEELEQRAQRFAERARQLLEELHEEELHAPAGDISFKSIAALHNFLQSQSCYAELTRRRDINRADRDRKRENRHFWIEIGLTIVIIALIGWEIHEGREQAALLNDMKTSTGITATLQTQTLELLRKQEADRARKPKLALFYGNTPIDSASVRLKLTGASHDMASLDLLLKNGGDAPVSPSRLHALPPEGVWLDNAINTFAVRQVEPEANGFTVQLPLLPAGQTARVLMQLHVPHGRPAFKIPFTVDAMELQSVTPLGSLMVLPAKP